MLSMQLRCEGGDKCGEALKKALHIFHKDGVNE